MSESRWMLSGRLPPPEAHDILEQTAEYAAREGVSVEVLLPPALTQGVVPFTRVSPDGSRESARLELADAIARVKVHAGRVATVYQLTTLPPELAVSLMQFELLIGSLQGVNA